ncbi:MAG: hypothetical protein L0Y72_08850 [Gemmataceae bacterium]|nr:hypothetical protein [Gemmataceae bacterium]MCI0739138.1 hypothetical protein [Gemmataceae bacterium]
MPRIILTKPPKPKAHDKLVKRLVQELKSPGNDVQPLILEQFIEGTGSRHVHVIWDDWQGLIDEQRSAVIEEAYAQAEGAKAASEITLASGVTPDEALVLGLLPFKVVPTRKRHEAKPPMADYKKAMKAESRRTVLGDRSEELRYPRVEDAEAAISRLGKALPGSEWTVVQEVPYES